VVDSLFVYQSPFLPAVISFSLFPTSFNFLLCPSQPLRAVSLSNAILISLLILTLLSFMLFFHTVGICGRIRNDIRKGGTLPTDSNESRLFSVCGITEFLGRDLVVGYVNSNSHDACRVVVGKLNGSRGSGERDDDYSSVLCACFVPELPDPIRLEFPKLSDRVLETARKHFFPLS